MRGTGIPIDHLDASAEQCIEAACMNTVDGRGAGSAKDGLFVNSSWNDLMFEAALTTHVPIVWSMFPIQVNLSISNWAFVSPILTENSVDEANMPRTVPSFGRGIVNVVRGDQAAGARHVAHDHGGIAGNVTTHVPCKRARIGVVTAAGRVADGDGDASCLYRIPRRRPRIGRRGEQASIAHCGDAIDARVTFMSLLIYSSPAESVCVRSNR